MSARRHPTILAAIRDRNLFAPWFKSDASWAAWTAFLAALFALPMSDDQRELYQQCTSRSVPPIEAASEAWLVCGRRAGKSFILALIAVFLATFKDYRPHLAPGERGTVMVIAADRKQARVIFRYIRGLLTGIPMLRELIQRETAESFDLRRSVTIEVATAGYRVVRGYTLIAALCDEIAFWPTDDAAEPDYEVLKALRPGMATIPGAMLLCASSPYARKGALWEAYRRHHGRDGDPILVWRAATRTMNPAVPQSVLDAAMERDPASAQAEYLAQFRSDLEAFVSLEAVSACVSRGVYERKPEHRVSYHAFVDPSGGSADSFTLAVGHYNHAKQTAVVDCIREVRPPFSPELTVQEFSALLKSYGVHQVVGDRYAGEWPREQFQKFGISYEPSAKSKSEIYVDFLPLVNSARVTLLDHTKCISQICSLERRTGRNRDVIDHPPNAHDDVANVVAGIAVHCVSSVGSYHPWKGWIDEDDDDPEAERAFRRGRLAAHIMRHMCRRSASATRRWQSSGTPQSAFRSSTATTSCVWSRTSSVPATTFNPLSREF